MTKKQAEKEARAEARQKKRHRLFMQRTLNVYSAMRRRADKLKSNAKLVFTIERFREAVEAKIGTSCRYCGTFLTLKNFSADHNIPLERGGLWRFSNINIICRSCNTAKGRMTGDEFWQFMMQLEEFDPVVKNEILGRLKAGASVVRLQFLRRRH